jgi:hypothetical protein
MAKVLVIATNRISLTRGGDQKMVLRSGRDIAIERIRREAFMDSR